ncbi:MAG: cupredoxin domain-containing protein [Actinomycetota bacterium]|nr:cupredoxin domain-containing protein [Actinomycetota bacterium]
MNWLHLLRWTTIAAIVVVIVINILAGIIPPLVVFAVIWIGGFFWLRSSTRGPAILLLVAFIAFLALSAPFVIPTLTVPASAGDFILNLGSLIAALVGIVAAIAVIRGRLETAPAARSLAIGSVGLFVLASVASVIATVSYEDAVAQEGDISLVTQDIEFQDESLDTEAGEVAVFVENKDNTLHTFTIDELDVDLDIPAAKSARVSFTAPPGTYEFYCVPHKETMEGTLVVE